MEELENALTDVFNSFNLTLEEKRYVVLTFWLNVENNYRAIKESMKNKEKEEQLGEEK